MLRLICLLTISASQTAKKTNLSHEARCSSLLTPTRADKADPMGGSTQEKKLGVGPAGFWGIGKSVGRSAGRHAACRDGEKFVSRG